MTTEQINQERDYIIRTNKALRGAHNAAMQSVQQAEQLLKKHQTDARRIELEIEKNHIRFAQLGEMLKN